jgi:YjbE family integral membrane protein
MDSDTTAFLLPLLQIIWIDLLLSGDNAIVIALACRSLPKRQRHWGVFLGAAGAVVLRVVFAFFIVELLQFPYVKIGGGLLLLWIALKLVEGDDDERTEGVKPATTLFSAVRIIILADAVMSLDNVVAIAAAARGSIGLVAFGLALSIPLIVFSSGFMLALLNRYPALVWVGSALLGWIAGELICEEPHFAELLERDLPHFDTWCAGAGATFVLAVAWLRRKFRPASEK